MAKTPRDDLEKRLFKLAECAVSELQAQLDVIAERREMLPRGGFDKDLSNSAAAVGRALTSAIGELRQLEKHDRHMTKTPEQRFRLVLAFVRELDAEHRALVKRELADAESGSVLS